MSSEIAYRIKRTAVGTTLTFIADGSTLPIVLYHNKSRVRKIVADSFDGEVTMAKGSDTVTLDLVTTDSKRQSSRITTGIPLRKILSGAAFPCPVHVAKVERIPAIKQARGDGAGTLAAYLLFTLFVGVGSAGVGFVLGRTAANRTYS
jgi:hypothetical protein